MKRRIFGLENEYGITGTARGQVRVAPEAAARCLFAELGLGESSTNVFLPNGARLYLDTGYHPEYATPECDDLLDLVAHDKAGERVLEQLLARAKGRLPELGPGGGLLLFKNNTDSAGNSYGCHENYLVQRRTPLPGLVAALVPFLVTRQVFAGAGSIALGPEGARFGLSQRAPHIAEELSGATVFARPMINTRDEPHADIERYRRLHVILGDSNMSEVATFLKVGATALVIDMVEESSFSGEELALDSSVDALHAINRDPTLRQTVRLRDGRAFTALDVQFAYLEACSRFARRTGVSHVARRVLNRWASVLSRLARDPASAGREVDWVIKQELLERYMTRHGLLLDDARVRLVDLLYHDIRQEQGLYQRLARAGKVERLVSERAIEQAQQHPPSTTRARVRGEFIRRARLRGREYQVDWGYVKIAGPDGEMVFCSDPFAARDERVERLVA